MTMMSSAKIASDQNGYAGIDSSAASALRLANRIAIKRPYSPPDHSEKPASSWSAPMMVVIQPQALRLLRMYFWSWMKNFESAIAAIPQMMLRMPTMNSITAAKMTQPE